MAMDIDQFLQKHQIEVDWKQVDQDKKDMLAEVRAYRLRELREGAGLTQQQLADRIGVSQRQISKIEHGDIDNAKVRTLRRYLEAVGGELELDFVIGDTRFRVA